MGSGDTELVIFDCDGVLIDSEIISAVTMIELLKPLGIEIDTNHIQQHFLGRSFPTVAQLISQQFQIELPADFEDQYRLHLLATFEDQLHSSNGIKQVLEKIDVPVCVATSSSPQRARRSLEITGLLNYFDGRIFTASQVANGKPAPDLFLFVAKNMQTEPRKCLVVEDSIPGLEAAAAADMKAMRYLGGGHFDTCRDAAQQEMPGVQCFDSWAEFFNITLMPEQ